MKTKTKKIISALGAAVMLASYAPMSMAADGVSPSDYYARNFLATDNSIYWTDCAQISWFNPAVKAEKISLYAKGKVQLEGDGSYVLLGDDYDTTANASVVTNLNTGNWAVTPRDCWYTFKLVAEFADGTQSEQLLDYYVPNCDTTKYHNNGVWKYITEVSEDFRTVAQRGGDTHGMSQGGDFFPMASEVVYDNGNPALKIWSNAHIASQTDGTGTKGSYNSGNYYGEAMLTKSFEEGESYDVSFKYKAKGIEFVKIYINNREETVVVEDTNGEWVNYSTTIESAAASTTKMIDFEFQQGNEELIIDDVVVKKTGTDANLLTDGDFSKLAAAAPANVTEATKVADGDNITLQWKDSADAKGVNVYKTESDGSQVKLAYVRNTIEKLELNTGAGTYTVKAVNANGIEASGAECAFPVYTPDKIAAQDFAAYDTRLDGVLVAWKNADIADIASVKLYKDDTLIDSFSTEANAFCSKHIRELDWIQYHTFKLVTTTVSGSSVEQYATSALTGKGDLDALGWAYTDQITDKFYVARAQGDRNFAPVHSEVVTENGNSYFKLQNAYGATLASDTIMSGTTYTSITIPYEKAGLEAGTTYTLSYKIKGAASSWAKCFVGSNYYDYNASGTVTTYKDWTEKSLTITEPATAANVRLVVERTQNGIPMCLDDITIKDASGKVVYSEDFENDVATFNGAPIMGLSATANETSVTLGWDAPGMEDGTTKYVRVYASTANGTYLAATLSPMDETLTLNNLEGDTDYTFYFDIITENGAASSKYSVDVKTVVPDYSIKSVKLLDSNSSAVTALAKGTYTAQAVVANNKVDNFKCQVIAALYDNGKFVKFVKSDVKAVSKGSSESISSASIEIPDTTGHSYTVEVYVWDSLDNMTPLCTATEF